MRALKDETKQKIVDNASVFFAKHGLSKTTIDDIAKSLRMGKSSLYYYFTSKEEIFKAVIEKEIELLSLRIRSALSEHSDPQEKLKVFGITRMQYLKDLINIYTAMKDDYLSHYAFIQRIRVEYDNREHELVRSILEEGVARGSFAIADTSLAAKAVITALKGFEYEWSVKENDIDIEKSIDSLLHILLNGILKK